MGDCPLDYEKILWLFGELPAPDRVEVTAHIDSCQRCADDVASLRRAAELLEARESSAAPGERDACLDEADLAAWLDGLVDLDAKARTLSHLAGCSRCRRAVGSLVKTLRSDRVAAAVRELEEDEHEERRSKTAAVTATPRRIRRTPNWRVWAPAAAAAAVIVLLILRPLWVETEPDGAARFRGRGSTFGRDGAVDIRVSAPPDESVASPTGITFAWHSGGEGASYQLTLTNGEGDVVWALATADTTASLPNTIELQRGSVYYWYVDGLLENGRHASSGVHSFTTRN